MLMTPLLRSHAARLTALTIAVGLSACGGSDSDDAKPDPLQVFRDQNLSWEACDDTILGLDSSKLWQKLGNRLQCANMRAPMDWSQPERGNVSVAVMRLAAGQPAQRRGAIAFNPGGPGADGLAQSLSLFGAFSGSNPDSPQGALQLRLLNEYDMVGFSPRGVGASTQLQCATNELERFEDASPSGAFTELNWTNGRYNDRKKAEACRKNPLTPHISSDATARDMDLLRGLLGDAKLNYVGYSYGTWLGGWYASLFPDKVGRMVLDSSQDFTSTHEIATLAMAPARQRVHQDILLPYAARNVDYFNLGNTTAQIDASMKALSPRVQDLLGKVLAGLTYQRSQAGEYLDLIAAAKGLDAALHTVADTSDVDAVELALQGQVFHPTDFPRDAELREVAGELFGELYLPRWVNHRPESISFNGTYTAVSCNDTPATTDDTTWRAIARDLVPKAPWFLGGVLSNPCATWGGPSVVKPDITAMQGLDVLMVQSQYDAATPVEGANRYFAALPSAKRIYVPGEFSHALYPYVDGCVDAAVTRYLLGESPAQREVSCQAHPLARDSVSKARAAGVSAYVNPQELMEQFKNGSVSAYVNPQEALELIEQFKNGIRR